MKFVCDRCQTKYSIADDRVRGKILKVKCKSCANVITVREARRPSAAYATVSATGHDSERTVLAPNPGMLAEAVFAPAPAPAPARQTGAHAVPAASHAAPDDGLAWYMALSGERSGPFSRKQLVDKVIVLPKNADLHVWNEKLGEWKPPFDVPAVANDLLARRKAPPPLPPGAPRRATPSPPPPPLGAPAHADRPAGRPTGSMAAVGSPLHPGGGLKLPPPTGGGHARPLSALAAAVAPARAPDTGVDIDPQSMLETPAPQPHMLHGHGGTNGVGHARATGAHATTSATRSSSDVLKLLNLPGAATSTPGAPPRLISASDTVGWTASVGAPAERARSAKLFLVLIGVVAVICMVIMGALGLGKKKRDPLVVAAPKAAVTDPLAGVVEKMNVPPPAPPPPVVAPVPDPPPPPAPVGRGKLGKGRGTKGRGTAPVGLALAAAPGPDDGGAAARYRDTSAGLKVSPTAANPSRPPPSQGDISKVINNNRGGIKNCYQRALLRDSSLTHGKITVKLTLGISGHVKHAAIDGPQQFRAVEPCIKELVGHWVFPQASDEYGTEFVYVFQGNE